MPGASRPDLLRDVAIGTAGTTGDGFLWTLVGLLGPAYGPGVVLLSEIVHDGLRALACWPAGELPAGETYPLGLTPGPRIAAEGTFSLAEGASAAFPDDPFLGPRAFAGYAGFACRSTTGEVVGVLELMSTGRLELGPDEQQALRIFSSWVGEEIERRSVRADLRARELELVASRAQVVAATDEARRRVGRDLHDGLQQRVLALKMLVGAVAESLGETAAPETASLLADAVDEAAAVGEELRSLARGLHPGELARRGLAGALEHLARRSAAPLEIRALPDRRPPAPVELTVYYLVSEALANSVRHAGAAPVSVEVTLDPLALTVVVADSGPGGADVSDGGSGLRGLQDRVTALGGTLVIGSPPGRGTTLTATIPLAPFRDAREPFIEFGHAGDGGAGAEKIRRILTGERRLAVSLEKEWELEGGPPRLGQSLAVRDHTGRRHAAVRVTRVAVMPLSLVDAEIAAEAAGHPVDVAAWRAELVRDYDATRGDLAVLFGEPDWRMEEDAPMVVIWFQVEAGGSPSAPDAAPAG